MNSKAKFYLQILDLDNEIQTSYMTKVIYDYEKGKYNFLPAIPNYNSNGNFQKKINSLKSFVKEHLDKAKKYFSSSKNEIPKLLFNITKSKKNQINESKQKLYELLFLLKIQLDVLNIDLPTKRFIISGVFILYTMNLLSMSKKDFNDFIGKLTNDILKEASRGRIQQMILLILGFIQQNSHYKHFFELLGYPLKFINKDNLRKDDFLEKIIIPQIVTFIQKSKEDPNLKHVSIPYVYCPKCTTKNEIPLKSKICEVCGHDLSKIAESINSVVTLVPIQVEILEQQILNNEYIKKTLGNKIHEFVKQFRELLPLFLLKYILSNENYNGNILKDNIYNMIYDINKKLFYTNIIINMLSKFAEDSKGKIPFLLGKFDTLKKSYLNRKTIPNKSIQTRYSSIFEKLYELPVGKNIWILRGHGTTINKVFFTKIPIIFESDLGKSKIFRKSKNRKLVGNDFLKELFSLSEVNPTLEFNRFKVYLPGDLVPDLRINWDFYKLDKNGKSNKSLKVQSGIIHLQKVWKNKNSITNAFTPSSTPKLNYHDKNTFGNFMDRYETLSIVVQELSRRHPNGILVVSACRDFTTNYTRNIRNLLNKVNSLNNSPPAAIKLKRNVSLSSTTLKKNHSLLHRLQLKKYRNSNNKNLKNSLNKMLNKINKGTTFNIRELTKLIELIKNKGKSDNSPNNNSNNNFNNNSNNKPNNSSKKNNSKNNKSSNKKKNIVGQQKSNNGNIIKKQIFIQEKKIKNIKKSNPIKKNSETNTEENSSWSNSSVSSTGFNSTNSNNNFGGNKYINIPNYGRRKIRYQKNGRPYIILNKKKIKL